MQVRLDVLFPDCSLPSFCDEKGNTPLHKLVQNKNSFEEFEKSVQALSKDPNFFEMLTTSNNVGEMPVIAIKDGTKDPQEKITLLADYVRQMKVKPFTEPLDLTQIDKEYVLEGHIVKNNLLIAAHVVNRTRSIFKESFSHPEINAWSTERQENLRARTQTMLNNFSFRTDFFANAVRYSKEVKIGQGENITLVALDILMKDFPNVFAHRYRIEGGNHLFLVVDHVWRDKNANSWWSDQAVACDPWSGLVYPIRELPSKLKIYEYSYEKSDRKTNWSGKLNPKFHKLQRKYFEDVDGVAHKFYSNLNKEKKE